MRRSERGARLALLGGRLFSEAQRILCVGISLTLPDRDLTHVADLRALAADTTFDAALVRLDVATDVTRQVAQVRRQLRAGACLLLTTPSRPRAVERARALVTRTPPVLLTLEPICEALLGLGLVLPRVHDDLPDSFLVSARLPGERTELDVFFEQPTVSASR